MMVLCGRGWSLLQRRVPFSNVMLSTVQGAGGGAVCDGAVWEGVEPPPAQGALL